MCTPTRCQHWIFSHALWTPLLCPVHVYSLSIPLSISGPDMVLLAQHMLVFINKTLPSTGKKSEVLLVAWIMGLFHNVKISCSTVVALISVHVSLSQPWLSIIFLIFELLLGRKKKKKKKKKTGKKGANSIRPCRFILSILYFILLFYSAFCSEEKVHTDWLK